MIDTTGRIPLWLIGAVSSILLRFILWIGFISIVIGGARF